MRAERSRRPRATAPSPHPPGFWKKPIVRKALRILLGVCLTLLVLTGIGLWLVYRATQHVPEFYQQALATPLPPQQLRQTSDQFERQVLELHNDARHSGRWEAAFTAEQVNAWLASDLERKLPHTLPGGLRDPRVKISPQGVQVACQYNDGRWHTVISLAAEVYLTDTPNEIAVRLRELRAGRLPLPLKGVLDRLTAQAPNATCRFAGRSKTPTPWP